MKKKLLITMGCSFTEGIGAYNLNVVPQSATADEWISHTPDTKKLYHQNIPRFHKFSWPSFLQKKIKYDKLLNISLGGSSNSAQAKRFFEILNDNNFFSDYEVIVLWGLTQSMRLSFYSKGKIKSIIPGWLPSNTTDNQDVILGNSYLEFIEDNFFDPFLEQNFYIKTVENTCKLHNFKFLYFTILFEKNSPFDIIEKFFPTKNYLNLYLPPHPNFSIKPRLFIPPIGHKKRVLGFTSPVCMHPNEYGYEFIADKIYNIVQENFSDLINNTEPELYESIHCGKPFDWQKILPYDGIITDV